MNARVLLFRSGITDSHVTTGCSPMFTTKHTSHTFHFTALFFSLLFSLLLSSCSALINSSLLIPISSFNKYIFNIYYWSLSLPFPFLCLSHITYFFLLSFRFNSNPYPYSSFSLPSFLSVPFPSHVSVFLIFTRTFVLFVLSLALSHSCPPNSTSYLTPPPSLSLSHRA